MNIPINKFLSWCGVAIGVFLLSYITYLQPFLSYPALLAILIAFSYLAYYFPSLAILLIIFELIIGGHGILLELPWDYYSFSLRQVLFIGFFTGFFFSVIKRKEKVDLYNVPVSLGFFFFVLILAFILGLLNNGFSNAFQDFTGYLFYLYLLPILFMRWKSDDKKDMMIMLISGAFILSILSLSLSFIFSHMDTGTLDFWYRLFRDRRVAEITLLVMNSGGLFANFMNIFLGDYPYFYRIFMPSQILLIPIWLFFFLQFLKDGWVKIRVSLPHIIFVIISASLLTSMSRSFAVGAGAVLLLYLGYYIIIASDKKILLAGLSRSVILFVLGIGLAVFLPAFSLFGKPDLSNTIFYETSANIGREAAVQSRQDLIRVAHSEIISAPILGYGMGRALIYRSSDPRILSLYNDGYYETIRFEWGYHDFLLKFGLIGLLIFFWLIRDIYFMVDKMKFRLGKNFDLAIKLSILTFLVIHIFTPYFNHPLGIAILLIAGVMNNRELWSERNILTLPTINNVR